MKVLTVYAHPDPDSFCHAVLQQFTKGLTEAGHASEVADLYAIGFNPVLTAPDFANWLIDEFTLDYPGIKTVGHEYFYAVNMADEKTLQGYFERAYRLGKEFSEQGVGASPCVRLDLLNI